MADPALRPPAPGSTEGPETAALEAAVAERDAEIAGLRANIASLESGLLDQKKANLTMKFNVSGDCALW